MLQHRRTANPKPGHVSPINGSEYLERRPASVKNKQRPSHAATGRRPAQRGAGHDLDGFVLIGRELRGIANRLKLAESCSVVIHMALAHKDSSPNDGNVRPGGAW